MQVVDAERDVQCDFAPLALPAAGDRDRHTGTRGTLSGAVASVGCAVNEAPRY